MDARYIRLWRSYNHHRRSPGASSSFNGFTPELLEVWQRCMCPAPVSFVVARRSLLIAATSPSTLGWLWRSLIVGCSVFPRRNSMIYWWYVAQLSQGALGQHEQLTWCLSSEAKLNFPNVSSHT